MATCVGNLTSETASGLSSSLNCISLSDNRLVKRENSLAAGDPYHGRSSQKDRVNTQNWVGLLYLALATIGTTLVAAWKIFCQFLSVLPNRASVLISYNFRKLEEKSFSQKCDHKSSSSSSKILHKDRFKGMASKSCFQDEVLAALVAKLQADVTKGFHHKFSNVSPDYEGTDFGSRRNGDESSEDGGSQSHTIQVDQSDQSTVPLFIAELQLISSSLNNSSFASDQSNEQPPPDRSPSGVDNGAEITPEEPEYYLSGLAETFLLVSLEEALATFAVDSVYDDNRFLLSLAKLFSGAGFLFCSCGYILQRRGRTKVAAPLMTSGGVVAAICAFVLMMGSLLTNF